MADDSDPIAIVGMAVRLPGGVRNTTDFWNLMVDKKSGLIPIPTSRWNRDGFYSAAARSGSVRNREAYMFGPDVDLARFDASYFTPGEKEIAGMDPMQRQLLEIARECLDSAGERDWRGKNIGCYVGSFSSDWQDDLSMDPHANGLYRGSGYLDFLQPNRVSYEYNWKGPSMLVKTGCSSSMVALHLAAEAVRSGAASSAMALGANLMTSVLTSIVFTETGVLSPSGKCKTFDLLADGYGRGEAVNAVYVKRLSHALRDGNPVRAIIRSSATNNDGRSNGIMSPNTDQQEALIRQTYAQVGLPFEQTAFFECHGTGTPTGDPLEVAAVARIWGDRGGIMVGAVKPNVGHSEGAAGLTSVIKGVLALENKTIPPNIYCDTLNPKIPWTAAKLSVPRESVPWPADKAARISVNSFGVAGSNAHMILESWESWQQMRSPGSPDSGIHLYHAAPRLLLFSAAHPDVLDRQVENHKRYIADKPQCHVLDDVAYTLAHHRERMGYRGYSIVDVREDSENVSTAVTDLQLLGRSDRPSAASSRRIVFVFTGQGAQWAGMGRELLVSSDPASTAFRDSLRRLDGFIRGLPEPYKADWSVEEELLKDKETSRVGKRGFSHPCATAVQIALVDLLLSLGLKPDAVTGHSGGEAAAAYASGSVSAEGAMAVAYFRGWVLRNGDKIGVTVPPGTMAAVGLGRREVEAFLIPGVVVGCENSQTSTTLSGDPVCIRHCVDQIKRRHPDITATVLDVETSFHSPWIEPLGAPYEKLLEPYLGGDKAKTTSVPHYSSVTGKKLSEAEVCNPDYWRRNFVQPVLFDSAVRSLLTDHPATLLVEVGPHPSLQSPVRDILKTKPDAQSQSSYVSTFRRGENSSRSLYKLAGELFVRHASVDLAKVVPGPGRVLTDLPTYPWLHDKAYMEQPTNAVRFKHRRFPRHDLLGMRVVEGNDIEPAWRNLLDLKEVPWLADHVVDGQVVYPAACYVAMAGEAVRQIVDGAVEGYTVRNMTLTAGLIVPHGDKKQKKPELYTRLIPATASEVGKQAESGPGVNWYNFRIMSNDGSHWQSHCTGFVRAGVDDADVADKISPEQAEADYPREVDAGLWYRSARDIGIEWKSAFQGLDLISAGTVSKEAAATVYDFGDDETGYAAHPTVLDQLLQINLVAVTNGLRRKLDRLLLPTSIGRLSVFGPQDMRMRAYGTMVEGDTAAAGSLAARAALFRDDGKPTVFLEDLGFAELPVNKKRETAMKLEDGQLLLGSYFTWDRDVTLADSLAAVEKPDEGREWRERHFQELKDTVALLGFKIPDARVLEIVSETGTTEVAQQALEALHPEPHVRFYSTYTLAVTSEDGVEEASLALKDFSRGEEVAAVGIDEVSLGGPLDLVIMSLDVLKSEDFFVQSELESLQHNMQPGSRLVVHQLEVDEGEDFQGKIDAAVPRLNELGFDLHAHSRTGIILAGPAREQTSRKTVTILTRDPSPTMVTKVKKVFEDNGAAITTAKFDGTIPSPDDADRLLISLLDLEGDAVVSNLDETTFKPFINTLCHLKGSMIWTIPPVHASVTNPNAAMVQGLVRSVRMEKKSADMTLIEVDEASTKDDTLALALWRIADKLDDRRKGGALPLDPDYDYALVDGELQIPRMSWFPLPAEAKAPSFTAPLFREDATYVLAGGMGGLGKSVATWMVENGAHHLIFLSRSAGDAQNEPFIDELRSYPGRSVVAVSGDVGSLSDVERVISLAPKPVAGVLQLSLVLRDNSTEDMTFDEWTGAVRPRVEGTWNLHNALSGIPLDFFVIFGSGGGHTGYYGQANYSAANSFLDAFVQYRHGLGLPASIIDLGVVGDVGYVLEQDAILEGFKAGGFFLLTETDVLQATGLAVANGCPEGGHLASFCLGGVSAKPLTDPSNKVNWKRDVRFAVASHMYSAPGARGSSGGGQPGGAAEGEDAETQAVIDRIRSDAGAAKDPATVAAVAGAVAGALSRLMLRPVFDFPLTESLTAIGLDSIISIELVDWIHHRFGIGLSSMEVTQCASLMHLAEKIIDQLVAVC